MNRAKFTAHRRTRISGIATVLGAGIGLFAAANANADVVVPLPDGTESGLGATLTRTQEQAIVSPSLAANGAGRVVWVSGTIVADVTETPSGTTGPYSSPNNSPGTNNSQTHGVSQVNTGYIVGCQVSVGDKAISAGLSGNVSTTSAGVGGSLGLQLGPGEVKFVQISFKDIAEPGVYSIGYRDVEMNIQGCAGYAQARSYSTVEIIGDNYSKTTLYGAPFSIG
ncbi:MspA family porin [Nocardia neocaledoniensis]|uniref:MspA family porin n=1 Tax=Nocardia neocaledoniensis TaxID=236511 RepID=UPI002453A4B9|nr:MspA family porin [Nocardia neocaledoniensis]